MYRLSTLGGMLLLLLGAGFSHAQKPAEGSAGPRAKPDVVMTAEKLIGEYKANAAETRTKYDQKTFEVTGEVHFATRDPEELGAFIFILKGKAEEFHYLNVQLDKVDVFRKLTPGQTATLRGVFDKGRCGYSGFLAKGQIVNVTGAAATSVSAKEIVAKWVADPAKFRRENNKRWFIISGEVAQIEKNGSVTTLVAVEGNTKISVDIYYADLEIAQAMKPGAPFRVLVQFVQDFNHGPTKLVGSRGLLLPTEAEQKKAPN